ncbi:hypothetical protein PIB30_045131 [Stylosanthes scabra]|uniref:RING-type E3 ubiquitin transferase n=1 Tax=Stylosanthes scabra TaxID=79078 RepID=A0ABU6SFX7_9FABA|nr:hypothetical protein [Stylosanthes scabra]
MSSSSSSSTSSSEPDHRGGGAAAATAYSTPPVLIAFVLVLLVICFVCFTLIYFCRCYFVSIIHTLAFHRSPSATATAAAATANSINNAPNSPFMGLDTALLEEFPTFPYSSVKDLRKEKKYGLECAICLLEFEDDSVLRLLTVCRHVFHQECVDLWLHRHKTCPVCRTDLETRKSSSSSSASPSDIHDHERQSVAAGGEEDGNADDVCIDVKEGGDEDGNNRFLRSHSTGHSIVMVREEGRDEDDDRYRLKLQQDADLRIVKNEMKKNNHHQYSRSCESYTEMMMTMMMAAKPLVPPCTNCGYVDHQTLSSSAPCSSRLGAAN